jgi:hypothetical protein
MEKKLLINMLREDVFRKIISNYISILCNIRTNNWRWTIIDIPPT